MLILAALAFAAVLALCVTVMLETLRDSGAKVIAALEGQSYLAQPALVTRPVTVRIVSRPVSVPLSARPQLRAAA